MCSELLRKNRFDIQQKYNVSNWALTTLLPYTKRVRYTVLTCSDTVERATITKRLFKHTYEQDFKTRTTQVLREKPITVRKSSTSVLIRLLRELGSRQSSGTYIP